MEGIKAKVGPNTRILTAQGAGFFGNSQEEDIAKAVLVAAEADVIILAVGEAAVDNGEAASRADIRLPIAQLDLVKAIAALGFGLSYTSFQYSDIRLSKSKIGMNETLTVTVDVTNTGKRVGEEVVQLYIRDLVGSVTRPVKELKGFQKLSFLPGEKKTVTFILDKDDLAFWHQGKGFLAEPGQFQVFVGTNSRDVKEAGFEVVK